MALASPHPEARLIASEKPTRREPSRAHVRRLFLSGLAFVHVLSLASFGAQLDGLVGSHGILPAEAFVSALRRVPHAFAEAPTITLFTGASDTVLHLHVVVGLLLAGCLALDLAPFLATFGLYAIALSVQIVGQEFLAFQWDLLLVETTFLALFLSPPAAILPRRVEPPRLAIVALRLLFARFLFSSGVAKLASGDPTWRDLSALSFHYETTCLPTWLGYLAHGLPLFVHRLSALAMFVIELVVPFLVFGSARMRRTAFLASLALQLAIGVTGNYGFFNVLTAVVSLAVLDDADVAAMMRMTRAPPSTPPSRASHALAACALALYVPLSFAPLLGSFHARLEVPEAYLRFVDVASPLRIANGYGLFAMMTTHRDEILLEGSRDGVTWLRYELRYQPGPLDRAPVFAGFHMPRLDWRMWFSALASPYEDATFGPFVKKLLEGTPEVRALLEVDPFGATPPRYVRARIARYHFTTLRELFATGAYFRRDALREYLPPVRLSNGTITFAEIPDR